MSNLHEQAIALRSSVQEMGAAMQTSAAVIEAVREKIASAINDGVLIDPLELLAAMIAAQVKHEPTQRHWHDEGGNCRDAYTDEHLREVNNLADAADSGPKAVRLT